MRGVSCMQLQLQADEGEGKLARGGVKTKEMVRVAANGFFRRDDEARTKLKKKRGQSRGECDGRRGEREEFEGGLQLVWNMLERECMP